MASPPSIPPHTISLSLLIIATLVLSNPFTPTTMADSSWKNQFYKDKKSIKLASTDYGNIVYGAPVSIFRPSSADDIINLIKNNIGVTHKTKNVKTMAVRARAHSMRGQPLALDGGIVINITTLNKTDGSRITVVTNSPLGPYVDAGGEQLWVDVLRATLDQGCAPMSWTDYLYASVGGTLSSGGIGGESFKYGPQISNVLELHVITGKGESVICSPSKNSELFFAVLGGLGQFGIITQARIKISKAPTRAKCVRLLYSNFTAFTEDQEFLVSLEDPSYVEGFVIVNESVTNIWKASSFYSPHRPNVVSLLKHKTILYAIELAKFYDNDSAEAADMEIRALMSKLNFIPHSPYTSDVTFSDFLLRVGNLDVVERGSLLSHPWLVLFIPKSKIMEFNAKILAGMLPRLHNSSDPYLFYPLLSTKWDNRTSAVIPNEEVFYTLGLLHSTPPGQYQSIDDFNQEILRACRDSTINIKEYLPHYTKKTDWKAHFGNNWGTFNERKNKFDPMHILAPGQRIFN